MKRLFAILLCSALVVAVPYCALAAGHSVGGGGGHAMAGHAIGGGGHSMGGGGVGYRAAGGGRVVGGRYGMVNHGFAAGRVGGYHHYGERFWLPSIGWYACLNLFDPYYQLYCE